MQYDETPAAAEHRATTETTKKNQKYPTVQEVLEWAKSRNGVVLREWVQSPTRCKEGRIVFPEYQGSRRRPETSPIVREVINQFYPNVRNDNMNKHDCRVLATNDSGEVVTIWVLESNIPALVGDVKPDTFRRLDFPPHGKTFRSSKKTVFLGVADVHVQQL